MRVIRSIPLFMFVLLISTYQAQATYILTAQGQVGSGSPLIRETAEGSNTEYAIPGIAQVRQVGDPTFQATATRTFAATSAGTTGNGTPSAFASSFNQTLRFTNLEALNTGGTSVPLLFNFSSAWRLRTPGIPGGVFGQGGASVNMRASISTRGDVDTISGAATLITSGSSILFSSSGFLDGLTGTEFSDFAAVGGLSVRFDSPIVEFDIRSSSSASQTGSGFGFAESRIGLPTDIFDFITTLDGTRILEQGVGIEIFTQTIPEPSTAALTVFFAAAFMRRKRSN